MEFTYTKKELIKQMFKIGVPVALQNLINVLVSMLDTIMLGQVGEAQLAAVNQVNSLYVFYTMFIWGVCMGTVVITARYWGMGKTEPIRDMMGFAIRINMIAGAVLSAVTLLFPHQVMRFLAKDTEVIEYGVEYLSIMAWFYIIPAVTVTFLSNLRALGDVKISVVIYTCSCLTNLVLNWMLIYGNLGAPALGVKGAAIATAISKSMECALALIYMYKIENKLNFRMRYIFTDAHQYIPSFIKYGLPVFFSEFAWGFGMTAQAANLGQYSKSFLAAYSLVMVILDLSTVAMCGFANASLILMGNMIGAGKDEEAKKWSKFFVMGGFCVGLVMMSIIFLIRPIAPNFIVGTDETKEYIKKMLIICAYVDFCYGVSWNLGAGVLRAGGDTKYMARMDVGVIILTKCIAGTILGTVLHVDPLIVMTAVCSDELIKGIIYLRKYLKGDWLKHGMTVKDSEQPA